MRYMLSNRTVRWLAGVAVVVGVGGASMVAVAEDQPKVNSYEPSAERVVPAELWRQTRAALDCVEARGFETFGPYPLASGAGLDYAIRTGTDKDTAAVESCLDSVQPYAKRFAFDNAPEVTGKTTEEIAKAAGTSSELATPDAAELWSAAPLLEKCLTEQGALKAGEAKTRADLSGLLGTAAINFAPQFDACLGKVLD